MRYPIKLENTVKHTPQGQKLGGSVLLGESETIVNINGVVGDFLDGNEAQDLVPLIQNISGDIRLRVNTPGGDVFTALDVHNALIAHEGQITADIVGQAASAGTIITAAADTVRIASAGTFMVHRAWMGFMAVGNAEEMRLQIKDLEATIDFLDRMDAELANILADRAGIDPDDMMELMIGDEGVDGTKFVGQEAVDRGFADSVIPNNRGKHDEEKNQIEESLLAAQIKLEQLKCQDLTEYAA